MDFVEVLFFVCDGKGCMEEADDPANSLVLFHPCQMTTESKCTWSSQLLGLHRFWKSALKKTVTFFSIAQYNIVCQEIDHRFLTVLGWRKMDEAGEDLQVQALGQNLAMLNHLLLSFVDSYAALAKLPLSTRHDLLNAVLALYPLTWTDLSHKSNHLNLFKDVDYLQSIASSLCHKCYIVAPQLSILSTVLAFRSDVIRDDMPVNLPQYRRLFLIASLRTVSYDYEKLVDNDDLSCMTRQHLYRLYIPTDDYQVFRLSRHYKSAINSIQTLSASPHCALLLQQSPPIRSLVSSANDDLRQEKEGRVCRLLYVLRQGAMSLLLLLDHNNTHQALLTSVQQLVRKEEMKRGVKCTVHKDENIQTFVVQKEKKD